MSGTCATPHAALYGGFGPGNVLPADGSAQTVAIGMRHVF